MENKGKKFIRSVKIGIDAAVPGMLLAEDIRNRAGGIVVAAESLLNRAAIDRIREMGLRSIYIETHAVPKEFDRLKGKNAIVLDDSLFIRHMFSKMLYRMGMFVIEELESPGECVEAALRYKPDLLVIDTCLPQGVSGIDVIKKLRPKLPQTKILCISAEKNKDTIVRAIKAGADDFMVKPIKWNDLKPRMQKLFAPKEETHAGPAAP